MVAPCDAVAAWWSAVIQTERVRCVLCFRRYAVEGWRTCEDCATDVRDALDDIVRLYADVEAAADSASDPDDLWPSGSSNVGSRKPAYKSAPPVNLDKIDAARDLAPREREVLDALHWWAWHVRVATGIAEPSSPCTVVSEVNVLVRMWDWLRRQPEIADLGRELLQLRDRLRKASAARWIQIGRCPTTTDPRTGSRCGHQLYARLGERTIRCGRCGTPYPSSTWLTLAKRMENG
jgi:hypothetical protein